MPTFFLLYFLRFDIRHVRLMPKYYLDILIAFWNCNSLVTSFIDVFIKLLSRI